MPIDPSIYGQIRPPSINTPFENLSQVLHVQAQQENLRSLKEQRDAIAEQRRAQTEKIRREEDDRVATAHALASGGGVRSQVLDAVAKDPTKAHLLPSLTKFFDDADEKAANLKKTKLAAADAEADWLGDLADGILQHGDTPENLLASFQSGLAYAVEQFPDYADSAKVLTAHAQQGGPEGLRAMLEHVRSTAPSRRAKPSGPVTVSPGSTLVDPQSGKAIYTAPPKPETKQFQSKEMLVGGQRENVNFDPDTGKWFRPGSSEPLDPKLVRPAPPQIDPTRAAIRDATLAEKQRALATLPVPTQRRVDALAKGFDSQPTVRRVQTMAEAVNFVNSLDPKTVNPADDQALIYAFAKAMDPESVVREGEYATVQKYAQSWAQNFGFDAARIFSNTPFLTAQARQNMKNTIAQKFKATQGQYDNLRTSYIQKINAASGKDNGADFLTDYGGAFPDAPAKSAPAPGAPAVAAPAKLPALGAGRIRARDKDGGIHEAAAGTPLPAGWTIIERGK